MPGVAQIGLGESARSRAPRRSAAAQLVGERLVVDEAVVAGRADGLLVEALGVELAAFDARDLGADQRGAVREVLRAVLGPHLELAVVGGQGLEVLGSLRRRGRIAERGLRQRGVEMVLRPLEEGRRRPEEAFCLRRRRDGGGVVAGEDARLQLADPVPAGGSRQARIRLQMPLEPLLVELGVVEAAELRRQTAQRPDQLELRGDDVDDETEPRLAREVEPGLGLSLHLGERIAAGEKVRDEVVAAVGRIGEVAGLLRRVEGAPHQRTARPDMPRPGIHDGSRRPGRRGP